MPKKVKARKNSKNKPESVKRELILKDEDQEYAQITSILGNRRFRCMCYDGLERIGAVSRCKKKNRARVTFILLNDIVLVSFRDFDVNKVDIIHKYDHGEISKLQKMGELPENIVFSTICEVKEEDTTVTFDWGEEDEDEEEEFNIDTI